MVEAMVLEMAYWSESWQDTTFSTLYFGGGTPSLLTKEHLDTLLKAAHKHFKVGAVTEFTLEVNPEDVTVQKLSDWKSVGVNRLSMGLQCFQDPLLQWMNRAHDAATGIKAVQQSYQEGIENISVDLIYGIPGLSQEQWLSNIKQVLQLPVNHVSCYGLTVEEKTALFRMVQQQKVQIPEDEVFIEQFDSLIDEFGKAGFEWYEISNLAKDQAYAQHNSSYWAGKPYLGIGPSAHSIKDQKRWFNRKSNPLYMKQVHSGTAFFESEALSNTDVFNERVMTGLRTKWGVPVSLWGKEFENPINILQIPEIEKLNSEELIYLDGRNLKLTAKGKHVADGVAARLFR